MTSADHPDEGYAHPWTTIDLHTYEAHMGDTAVGQLQQLHEITRDQLVSHPSRTVGILGVAGGNGLDLIDPATTESVDAYDINRTYLDVCEARYRPALGGRLRLVEADIGPTLTIHPVELLIANLIVEYVGTDEFAAFVHANARSIGVLSCVTQRNDGARLVSQTAYASSFDGLSSIASEVDPHTLVAAMAGAGFDVVHHCDYPLRNAKRLVRHDFRSTGA